MLKNLERMIFERCVAHVTLRPDAFSMEKDRKSTRLNSSHRT